MNERIHLHGNWQAEGAGKRFALAIPGDVHSALLDAGHIEDPYWGTNELDIQHLHGEDWLLTHSVSVDADFLQASSVYLHFDSIDTVVVIVNAASDDFGLGYLISTVNTDDFFDKIDVAL